MNEQYVVLKLFLIMCAFIKALLRDIVAIMEDTCASTPTQDLNY